MSLIDDRESFYRLQHQLEKDMKEADADFFLLKGVIQYLSVDQVEDFVRYFRRVNDLPEQPKVEKYEDDDLEELEVEEYEDEDGNAIFVIPGVQFTGDENSDLAQLKDPVIYNWIFPNFPQKSILGHHGALTDSKMLIIYEGDDVRDYLEFIK